MSCWKEEKLGNQEEFYFLGLAAIFLCGNLMDFHIDLREDKIQKHFIWIQARLLKDC